MNPPEVKAEVRERLTEAFGGTDFTVRVAEPFDDGKGTISIWATFEVESAREKIGLQQSSLD